jgi:pyridoxal phosphate enzyme (YggS family)
MSEDAVERFLTIRRAITRAADASGRTPDQVVLVGACKRQPPERILAAYDAGLRVLGENIVQEALGHQEILPADTEWHLIGPLQSNKATKAVRAFSCVHSIDRQKIARILDRCAGEANVRMTGMLEINLGGESSKHGFDPDTVIGTTQELAELENLRIEGLMAIPPFETDPEASRVWFRRLRELRDEFFSRALWSDRRGLLSMGMSSDYTIAIEEGATHVRIGTLLFGPREPR